MASDLSPRENAVIDVAIRAMAATADEDSGVLVAIKNALEELVPFDRLSVVVDDEENRTFRLLWHTTTGRSAPVPPIPFDTRYPYSPSFFDDQGRPQTVVATDSRTRTSQAVDAANASGLKSFIAVPIVNEGTGLGFLVIAHEEVGAPSQRVLPLLNEIGRVIAPAVLRARMTARYRLLASLVEESPDGMMAVDRERVVTEVNSSAEGMIGLPRERILGRALADLIGRENAAKLEQVNVPNRGAGAVPVELYLGKPALPVDALMTRGSGVQARLQIHLRDARARKAAEEASARRVEQLAFLGALGEVMASDLRADKALSRAVDLCFVRFELGALCAFRADTEGSLRLVASHGTGPKLRKRLECVRDEDLEQLFGPGAPEAARTKHLVHAKGIRLPDDASDGRPRWVTLAPLVHARRRLGALLFVGHAGDSLSEGDRETWGSIANTISITLRAADDFEHVVALEAEKRQLVDNLPVIVARLDPTTGATLFANGAVERALGVPLKDVFGMPGIEALLADAAERTASAATRERAKRGLATCWQDRRYRHVDGRILTFRECVYPMFDAAHSVPAVEVIAYDITAEIEAQKKLMQSDRLASIGALAAGIAHEINNPVAFITLASAQIGRLVEQTKRREPGAEERLVQVADEISESASRIAEIVGELKLFTRIPDGASACPVDINRILQTSLTLTSAELRSRAKVDVKLGELPLAPGGFVGLGHAFANLLLNAAQAIAAKGESTRANASPKADSNGSEDVVRVSTAMREGAIVVEIGDTGVGIDPRVLPRIFDPFFKAKSGGEGAGLGLAIAYDLVRRVGGDIRVRSAPGLGTTFEVVLPLGASPDGRERERADALPRGDGRETSDLGNTRPKHGRRVLIIDDERALAKVLARQLEGRYEVDTATTASEALAQLRVRVYDAVICDLRMPDQSGPAIHDFVHAESPDQASRFIFTTGGSYGTGDDQIQERALRTGLPLLEKPFDESRFESTVARVAGRVQLAST